MIRRPRPGEDDLEAMLADFEAQKSASGNSGTGLVTKRKQEEDGEKEVKKTKSKFAQQRENQRKQQQQQQDRRTANIASLEPTRDQVVVGGGGGVLGAIVERSTAGASSQLARPPCRVSLPATTGGFPAVIKLQSSAGGARESKQSLFAQQFNKMKQGLASTVGENRSPPTTVGESSSAPTTVGDPSDRLEGHSRILTGCGLASRSEADELHKENLQRLEAMPEEEILAEQEKLKAQLDPRLLAFLRSKKTNQGTESKKRTNQVAEDTTRTNQVAESTTSSVSKSETNPMETVTDKAEDTGEIVAKLKNKYPNMNRDEPEKREWMSDLPTVQDVGKVRGEGGGHTARFGLDGVLLPHTAQFDVQSSGLYHHGEEPERAGYSLDELFNFIRSTNSRQRVFGLETLSAVLEQYWTGVMDSCFSENPVEEMIRSGLVSILRSCLDEKEESVVFAGAVCLARLVSPQGEEAALDYSLVWALEQPQLIPQLKEEEREEEEELKDHELVQLDVIKALLRMDILPRIRYILTVLRPGPGTVLSCLSLLIRICRHSLGAAVQVMRCPDLMSTILTHFLPPSPPSSFTPSSSSSSSLYGVPVSGAIKLCRVAAAWDKRIAAELCSEHHLADILLVYLTLDPAQAAIPSREAALLCVEAYRTWTVALKYGLATSQFLDLFPVLARQLLYFVDQVDVVPCEKSDEFNYDIGAWLVTVLTAALGATEHGALEWRQVADLKTPVETCARKWLTQLTRSTDDISNSAANLVGCCLQFLAVFYVKLKSSGPTASDPQHQLEADIRLTYSPLLTGFLTSPFYQRQAANLNVSSGYLSGLSTSSRSAAGLPNLHSVLLDGRLHPVLTPGSSSCCLHLLTSLHRFIATLRSAAPVAAFAAGKLTTGAVLAPLQGYLGRLCGGSLSLVSSWYSRFEARLLFWVLATQFYDDEVDPRSHRLSLSVCGLLQTPDHLLVQELMEKMVFSPKVMNSSLLTERWLGELSLAGGEVSCPLTAGKLGPLPLATVLQESLENISDLKESYLKKLMSRGEGELSAAHHNLLPSRLARLTTSAETVLAQDWPYFPLLEIYNRELAAAEVMPPDQSAGGKKMAPKLQQPCVAEIRHCLAWLLLADTDSANESSRQQKLTAKENSRRQHSAASKYYRLATVFLSSSDLFLDPGIHTLLAALIRTVISADLSLPVPGLTSGHEFYLQLLDQFQAVSYGDELFSLYLTLPLAMHQPAAFRRSLWTERLEAVRLITLKEEHWSPADREAFTHTQELDTDILTAYLRALLDGTLVKQRNALMYSIAVSQLKGILLDNPAFLTQPDEDEDAEARRRELAKFRAASLQALAGSSRTQLKADLGMGL